jgi:hypothetical protein
MDVAKPSAVTILEKAIKTYMALARSLSRMGIQKQARRVKKRVQISPTFYKERMKEAKKMLHELKK